VKIEVPFRIPMLENEMIPMKLPALTESSAYFSCAGKRLAY
jgi:hypothetical protein